MGPQPSLYVPPHQEEHLWWCNCQLLPGGPLRAIWRQRQRGGPKVKMLYSPHWLLAHRHRSCRSRQYPCCVNAPPAKHGVQRYDIGHISWRLLLSPCLIRPPRQESGHVWALLCGPSQHGFWICVRSTPWVLNPQMKRGYRTLILGTKPF